MSKMKIIIVERPQKNFQIMACKWLEILNIPILWKLDMLQLCPTVIARVLTDLL